MCNDPHWNPGHSCFIPTLGGEPLDKSRPRQVAGQPLTKTTGNNHGRPALRERDITCNTAKRHAKSVECSCSPTVRPGERQSPQRLNLLHGYSPTVHRCQNVMDGNKPRPRQDTLNRNAVVKLPQAGQQGVLQCVERREVDMPPFSRDDVAATVAAEYLGYAKPGPGTDNADHLIRSECAVGSTNMRQMLRPQAGDGVANGCEVVDQYVSIETQRLANLRRAETPGIVGELEHLPVDRAGNRQRSGSWNRTPSPRTICFPGGLQAGMVSSFQGHRLTKRDDTAIRHLGKRKAGMCPANIDGDKLHYSPAAVSMAEAPCSASSAPCRIRANNSRPVPSNAG